MAVFITLVTEPIQQRVFGTSGRAGLSNVRRPLRGLEIKEDTYAYIKLVRIDGTCIDLLNSSVIDGKSTSYSNFLLQSVQESRAERTQMIETFGDTYLMLFGESPRMLQVQSQLINSLDFNWEAEFDANYEQYLRGTKAIEQGARTYLFYDDNVVEGYILNAQKQKTSDSPLTVQLSFQFFVMACYNVSLISNKYPMHQSATIPSRFVEDLSAYKSGLRQLAGENAVWNPKNAIPGAFNIWRDEPLRENIYDNLDEYTNQPRAHTYDFSKLPAYVSPGSGIAPGDMTKYENQDLSKLHIAILRMFRAFGVQPMKYTEDSLGPLGALGLMPTFLPAGIGFGAGAGSFGGGATFGAVAGCSTLGGFVGTSKSTGGISGLASSAQSIFDAGKSYARAALYDSATGGLYGVVANATSQRNQTSKQFGMVAALPYPVGGPQQGYANSQAAAAALAGGYVASNAYLGYTGASGYGVASYAGGYGSTGGGVLVGGSYSAFGSCVCPGTLINSSIPPSTALSYYDGGTYAW